jgi:hypothetical protein
VNGFENCEILALVLALESSLLLRLWGAVMLLGPPEFENCEMLALELVLELSLLLQV